MSRLFLLLTTLFALAPAAPAPPPPPPSTTAPPPSAAPKPTPTPCAFKQFNTPWLITDLDIFSPPAGSAQQGRVSFQFRDFNAGLGMATECTGTVVDGGCSGDGGGYAMCDDEDVGFQIQPSGVVLIERAYVDDCLGEYPYNSGVVFGQNSTELVITKTPEGLYSTQTELEIHVTEQT